MSARLMCPTCWLECSVIAVDPGARALKGQLRPAGVAALVTLSCNHQRWVMVVVLRKAEQGAAEVAQ